MKKEMKRRIADIVKSEDYMPYALEKLGVSPGIGLSAGDDFPCYFGMVLSSEEIRDINEAEIVIEVARLIVDPTEAVIMVSTTTCEPAHKDWLALAKKLKAKVNVIERRQGGAYRLVYTILFSATPYKEPKSPFKEVAK
jgi:hypothetical protein